MHFRIPARIKLAPKNPLSERTPVINGPILCADVFTTLIDPMIAVRLSLGSAAAKNAERGATSMFWEQARRTRKVNASGRSEGTGISAKNIADGRCVKTIVRTLPIRFAMEEAISIEPAEMMLVVKKIEPSFPSGSENFRLKKYVIHDLAPLAKLVLPV